MITLERLQQDNVRSRLGQDYMVGCLIDYPSFKN